MKKISILLSFFIVFISCANKVKEEEKEEEKVEETGKQQIAVDTVSEEKYQEISGVGEPYYPKTEEALKRCQRRVREEGDAISYDGLVSYYAENPHLEDEMIGYTEIMIKKKERNEPYIMYYYEYVEQSKSENKTELMKRAIKYMKEMLKREEKLENKNEGFFYLARKVLSNIYREGTYVPRDTVIAEYLDAGGNNLDSIIRVRQVRHVKKGSLP
ncbi:hypothetical protein [Proteiniphilum sp.]|uniref:hypothetical protein n=1 Tax=Proteiniphilum sp. TaxID=1926877 RepID=UPI002B2026DD|nr:hypothetical protein [Proteiniphilum sp.]MEA4917663.1 hypothetical protein [Proteiniphilum sp.]